MSVIAAPLAFSTGAYNEAIGLLHETRDHLLAGQKAGHDSVDAPVARLRINAEYSRVTSRLAHVVAWLMAQKAVEAGEATWETALASQPPLASVTTCTEQFDNTDNELPECLRDLLDRSHELYIRVARLDEQARMQRV